MSRACYYELPVISETLKGTFKMIGDVAWDASRTMGTFGRLLYQLKYKWYWGQFKGTGNYTGILILIQSLKLYPGAFKVLAMLHHIIFVNQTSSSACEISTPQSSHCSSRETLLDHLLGN